MLLWVKSPGKHMTKPYAKTSVCTKAYHLGGWSSPAQAREPGLSSMKGELIHNCRGSCPLEGCQRLARSFFLKCSWIKKRLWSALLWWTQSQHWPLLDLRCILLTEKGCWDTFQWSLKCLYFNFKGQPSSFLCTLLYDLVFVYCPLMLADFCLSHPVGLFTVFLPNVRERDNGNDFELCVSSDADYTSVLSAALVAPNSLSF